MRPPSLCSYRRSLWTLGAATGVVVLGNFLFSAHYDVSVLHLSPDVSPPPFLTMDGFTFWHHHKNNRTVAAAAAAANKEKKKKKTATKKSSSSTTATTNGATTGNNSSSRRHSSSSRSSSLINLSHLYVHIGPHKTGTTTIQDLLARHYQVLLEQDNVVFLGKINKEMEDAGFVSRKHDKVRQLVQWMMAADDNDGPDDAARVGRKRKRGRNSRNSSSMDVLQTALQECAKNHQHVILSNEAFSDVANSRYPHMVAKFVRRLHQIADGLFDVHVVLVYRRYYDWLPSLYKYRTTPNRLIFTDPTHWARVWPHQPPSLLLPPAATTTHGGRGGSDQHAEQVAHHHHYRQLQTMREFLHVANNQSLYPYQQSIQLYTAPSPDTGVTWSLHVINMHNLKSATATADPGQTDGDIGIDFLCHVVTPARHACQALQQEAAAAGGSIRRSNAARRNVEETTDAVAANATDEGRDVSGGPADTSAQQEHRHNRLHHNLLSTDYELLALFAYDHGWVKVSRRRVVVKAFERAFGLWSESKELKEVPWALRRLWKTPHVELEGLDESTREASPACFLYDENVTVVAQDAEFRPDHLAKQRVDIDLDAVIPLECPTKEEYDLILHTTMEHERVVLGPAAALPPLELERIFQRTVIDTHALCNVDLEILFHRRADLDVGGHRSWQRFIDCTTSAGPTKLLSCHEEIIEGTPPAIRGRG